MKRFIRKNCRLRANTSVRIWKYWSSAVEVLEFGCGTGSTAIAHAPYVRHIRVTDISSKMIEIAQGKARAANVNNVTFEAAAIGDLDISDQSLDAVLGLSILHLLEDKDDIIDRVYHMLKPGGVFVTSTPCVGDNMKFFKFIGPIGRFLRLLPLIKVFTKKELEDSITNAGFEIDHSWQPGRGKAVFIVAKKNS
jgi:ubiquinone/menaquinone biosynthesis C-methylase UbiE